MCGDPSIMTKNNLTARSPVMSWGIDEESMATTSDELSSDCLAEGPESLAPLPSTRGTTGAMLLVVWLALLASGCHLRRKAVGASSDKKTTVGRENGTPAGSTAGGEKLWTLGFAMDAILCLSSDLFKATVNPFLIGGRHHKDADDTNNIDHNEEDVIRGRARLSTQTHISADGDSNTRRREEPRPRHTSTPGNGSARRCTPRHVAVIMDGNRRFGRVKHGDALKGHADGGKKLGEFLEWCMEAGVSMVTAFAFSTENWKRDAHEVKMLMDLVCKSCGELMDDAVKKNLRIRVLTSDTSKLPERVVEAIRKAEEETRDCTGFLFNICLSYGARQEIAKACRQIAGEVERGMTTLDMINETTVERHLSTAGLPDPDVLIRTSGEKRMAYTELFFVDKLWPEVTKDDILDIFQQYEQRERRFGR